jgi:LPXTG-site transpeptidase (sortase) family protein
MYRRRLVIYMRRSYQRQGSPLVSLMTILVLGLIIGGMFTLYERMAPPAASSPRQPVIYGPLIPATLTPLAIPTVTKLDSTTFFVPTAGVHATVVEVFLNGESWDVSHLGYNAGHLQGTAPFGTRGNLVLVGHVEMADGRPGIFASINTMQVGDPLILSRGQLEKRYAVSQVRKVEPGDLSVLYPTTSDQLTLITCGDYDFLQNQYLERIVVIATGSA